MKILKTLSLILGCTVVAGYGLIKLAEYVDDSDIRE